MPFSCHGCTIHGNTANTVIYSTYCSRLHKSLQWHRRKRGVMEVKQALSVSNRVPLSSLFSTSLFLEPLSLLPKLSRARTLSGNHDEHIFYFSGKGRDQVLHFQQDPRHCQRCWLEDHVPSNKAMKTCVQLEFLLTTWRPEGEAPVSWRVTLRGGFEKD